MVKMKCRSLVAVPFLPITQEHCNISKVPKRSIHSHHWGIRERHHNNPTSCICSADVTLADSLLSEHLKSCV